jgi:hypothetical protein
VDSVEVVARLQQDRPKFHVGGTRIWNAMPESLSLISELVAPGDRTVETGCGASTVVFASRGSRHTVISPDSREHDLVHEYCASIGVDDSNVTYLAASSDAVLPTLFNGREVDLAFIDGAHSFPYPVIDWHYIAEALKVGGRILVDDVSIPAVAPVYRFMAAEDHWSFERLADDRAALFVQTALPPSENYHAQNFNRHADYSFTSLAGRTRIQSAAMLNSARAAVSERYPRLHQAWKRGQSLAAGRQRQRQQS